MRFINCVTASYPPGQPVLVYPHPSSLQARLQHPRFNLEDFLPIKTTDDLLQYADDVAGSIASTICYLSWSILDSTGSVQPVKDLAWSASIRSTSSRPPERLEIVQRAREMGCALQLVNVARDVAKDANIGRLYIPLAAFPSGSHLLDILLPPSSPRPSYSRYTLPLLDIADKLRRSSAPAMNELPRTARGGARAMAASYFEIAEEVRRRAGEVTVTGVKVKRRRRAWAAVKAMWGLDFS